MPIIRQIKVDVTPDVEMLVIDLRNRYNRATSKANGKADMSTVEFKQKIFAIGLSEVEAYIERLEIERRREQTLDVQ